MSKVKATIEVAGAKATLTDDGTWTSSRQELADMLNRQCAPGEDPDFGYDPAPFQHAAQRAVKLFGAKIISVEDEPEAPLPDGAVY